MRLRNNIDISVNLTRLRNIQLLNKIKYGHLVFQLVHLVQCTCREVDR